MAFFQSVANYVLNLPKPPVKDPDEAAIPPRVAPIDAYCDHVLGCCEDPRNCYICTHDWLTSCQMTDKKRRVYTNITVTMIVCAALHVRCMHAEYKGYEDGPADETLRLSLMDTAAVPGLVWRRTPMQTASLAARMDQATFRFHAAFKAMSQDSAQGCDACKLLFEVMYDEDKGLLKPTADGWRRLTKEEEEEEKEKQKEREKQAKLEAQLQVQHL